MAIFPLAPDQTIAQMWSNGVWGDPTAMLEKLQVAIYLCNRSSDPLHVLF